MSASFHVFLRCFKFIEFVDLNEKTEREREKERRKHFLRCQSATEFIRTVQQRGPVATPDYNGAIQRNNILNHVILAEINLFQRDKVRDLHSYMKILINEQIQFYERVKFNFLFDIEIVFVSIVSLKFRSPMNYVKLQQRFIRKRNFAKRSSIDRVIRFFFHCDFFSSRENKKTIRAISRLVWNWRKTFRSIRCICT